MVKSVLIRTLANLLYISTHSQVIGHANVVVDDCVPELCMLGAVGMSC
jgi:hypothetical protein